MISSLQSSCRRQISLGGKNKGYIYSLPALEEQGIGRVSRIPVSLRIVLESLIRNCDGRRISEKQIRELAQWQPKALRTTEIPFQVGRIVINDMGGIAVLGDIAAMRSAAKRAGNQPGVVGPTISVIDMVIDHTIAVDYHASPDALERNMRREIDRHEERFRFIKWAIQAFKGIRLIPPGFGILHQVNLEFLARGVLSQDDTYYPDTLVGPDSHTCMIAGLGVVGWGIGGIELEAAMLGEPVYFLTPDVVGVHVVGEMQAGTTITDVVLHVTRTMRNAKVVGKFVEFFGKGVAKLSVPDRATIANMAPEYGATLGFFPFDEQTRRYFHETARDEKQIVAAEAYLRAQGLFGAPRLGDIDYSEVLTLDLAMVVPNVAGPKRPQDLIPLPELKRQFETVLRTEPTKGGYGKDDAVYRPPESADTDATAVGDGDVLIAAITSCVNTSNPGVMLAAGLIARKAVERGLTVKPWVKTSLAPGSLVVTKYLEAAGLQHYLDKLGFSVVGYGCSTCVGNSGPIDETLEEAVNDNNVVACAVLSGNRNFEARVHPSLRAAYLMSPPLVVAFAIAGRVNIDLTNEPLGRNAKGDAVYLRNIWPTQEEIASTMSKAMNPDLYRAAYNVDFSKSNPMWEALPTTTGQVFPWNQSSSYFKEPPYFLEPRLTDSSLRPINSARALVILGDSITTDHISPIGHIETTSPAGQYLQSLGIAPVDFSSYGARRMNHEVMVRGTFANIRLRNLMVPGVEGGITVHQPSGEQMTIFDAATRYQRKGVPLLAFAGEDYGTGSARDWAAKGVRLLGVNAVIANGFERIHRSNLVCMGVLPLQFADGTTLESLKLLGDELFSVSGISENVQPRERLSLEIKRANRSIDRVSLVLRADMPIEIEYLKQGGILSFVLRQLLH